MTQKKIEAYFATREAELVEAISRLIAIPSVRGSALPGAPFGEACANALSEALLIAKEWGLSGENLEGYVGVVDLCDKETSLHILAHLDVVAAGPAWTVTEAFSPKLVDGLLYGRGTSDDKGPFITALLALRAVKDLNIPLSRNVRLIMGTDEESGFHDIEWYYARHPYAPYAFSPDAHFPIINLEKGHLQPFLRKQWSAHEEGAQLLSLTGSPQVNMVPPTAEAVLSGLSIEEVGPFLNPLEAALSVRFALQPEATGLSIVCHGHATHASTPEAGTNALTALIALLCRLPLADCESTRTLRALHDLFPHGDHLACALGLAQEDARSGPLTLTLSMMEFRPDGMEARFDCRTPLCATSDSTLSAAQAALAPFGIAVEGALNPAHHVPEDAPFIQTLLHCYEQYSGKPGACLSMGGGTYVHDIPGGVAFGACMPGFESHLHEPDERVSVAELMLAAQIFTQAIIDLCS